MRKLGKRIVGTLLGVLLVSGATLGIFLYKITYGFPVSYETTKPRIVFPRHQSAILVFSKTTGFRHGESIRASRVVFNQMAKRNNWFIYQTEEGGVFNPEQLAQFKAVIFNNSTGRVLNEEQQQALSRYVEAGGVLLGIHGAGDNSHHWPWYEQSLLGTQFSHHPIHPQFQKTTVHLESTAPSNVTQNIPLTWEHEDEWYVFYHQPRGAQVVAYINGNQITPNGNMLWIRNKNFGMGNYHPVAWYRTLGKGKTFYTAMGHSKETWQNAHFVQLIGNALQWALH